MAKTTSIPRGALVVPVVITTFVSSIILASCFISDLLNIPQTLQLPVWARMTGVVLLVTGFSIMASILRHRRISEIITSTYITFLKAGRKVPLQSMHERREPLVLQGPYKYVRHPMYFAVVILIFGWGLLLDLLPLILTGFILLAWFNFVVAPFEEKELLILYGEEYKRYMSKTAKIIPFTKRSKATKNSK